MKASAGVASAGVGATPNREVRGGIAMRLSGGYQDVDRKGVGHPIPVLGLP